MPHPHGWEPKLTKPIEGQPSSQEVRQRLKDENRPVMVAFSGGKDSIAATLALQDDGIEVIPVFLYGIPGKFPASTLSFVEESIDHLEDALGLEIRRYPHPNFWNMLASFTYQPPERIRTIQAQRIPRLTFEQAWEVIREVHEMPEDTWVADGVRASDSLVRRASIKRHGAMKPKYHKVSPVYDWLQGAVYERIEMAGIKLSKEYELFGRSFDGIDYRFLKPVYDHYPDDYQQILKWFPLAELDLLRHGDI